MSKNKNNTLIWSIEQKNQPKSYWIGTMHLDTEAAFKHAPQFKKVIDKCQAYYAEMNFEGESGNREPHFLPNEQVIGDFLKPKEVKFLSKLLLKKMGIELWQVERFRPMVLLNQIVQSGQENIAGETLDMHLWNYAKQSELKMSGLETVMEQEEILINYPLDIQVKDLKSFLKKPTKGSKKNDKIMNWYAQAELQKLYRLSKKGLGKMKKVMLYDRNKVMAKRANQYAMEQASVFAVGAAHLLGEKGVLNLLKKEGWKVRPIKMKA